MIKRNQTAVEGLIRLESRRLLSVSLPNNSAATPAVCACGWCGGRFCTPDGRSAIDVAIENRRDPGQDVVVDYGNLFASSSGKKTKPEKGAGRGGLNASETSGDGSIAGLSSATTSGGEFDIVINFTSSVSSAVAGAFAAAEAKWESILLGDLPDRFVSEIGTVDDLYIDASIIPIDGAYGTLGQAGPTRLRSDTLLPYTGIMEFDSADMSYLDSTGGLEAVILHEMGHVLGVGTLWSSLSLRSGSGTSDPLFTGSNAITQYDTFIDGSVGGVPVENTGGTGTRDAHWRESAFNNELMTGYLNSGSNPLSRMTAASLIDLGYPEVNIDAADLYELPSGASGRNDYPRMSGLAASPAVSSGPVTLTASGISDGDGLSGVSFWRESNGLPGLQSQTGNPDLLIGTDTSSAGGWAIEAGDAVLLEGFNTFYARPTDSFGAVGDLRSATADYDPDTVPPEAIDRSFALETAQVIELSFSEMVDGLSGSDLQVVNLTTGQTIASDQFSFFAPWTGQDITWEYNGILPNGDYRATLPAGSMTDLAGNPLADDVTLDFFVLAGDANRDRRVDILDFGVLRANFGQSGRLFSQGNFNYSTDGMVDILDFGVLRANFGVDLGTPPASSLFGGTAITDGQDGEGTDPQGVTA